MRLLKFFSAMLLALTALFVHAAEVINSGHSGWNSRQLREIFDAELAKHKPDLIVLMIGTNDVLNSYNLIPVDEYQKNLEAMIKAAQGSGAKLLLCEIPNACEELLRKRHKPDFSYRDSAADKIKRANTIIAELAEKENIPLFKTTVVLGEATTEAASLFRNAANSGNEDGVHPTPLGYFRFADALAKRIKAAKWNPKRILCIGDSITYGVGVKGAGTAAPDAETYPGRLAKELKDK